MGLLSGAGRRLKGLFGDGGLVDTLAEAQAWLEGDYERGITLARRERARPGRLPDYEKKRELIAPEGDAALADFLRAGEEGMIIEEPLTKMRMVYTSGEWRPLSR